MITTLTDILFGCWHRNFSFPLTRNRANGAYVVCLDCGREFPYDWQAMKVLPHSKIQTKEPYEHQTCAL